LFFLTDWARIKENDVEMNTDISYFKNKRVEKFKNAVNSGREKTIVKTSEIVTQFIHFPDKGNVKQYRIPRHQGHMLHFFAFSSNYTRQWSEGDEYYEVDTLLKNFANAEIK